MQETRWETSFSHNTTDTYDKAEVGESLDIWESTRSKGSRVSHVSRHAEVIAVQVAALGAAAGSTDSISMIVFIIIMVQTLNLNFLCLHSSICNLLNYD